jgi:thiamine-monophosphate kinase
VSRAGARPGDFLYVTGALGGARAAVRLLETRQATPELRDRYARPVARIAEARWLAARGIVAAIDLSDGLRADAAHLAAASDVALEIDADRVPVASGATPEDALAGGDDYELLVASRTPLPEAEFARRFSTPLTAIGRAVEGGYAVHLLRDGKRVAAPSGYDHFSR